MSKKSTSSFLERTRFTASPNSQTGIPLFVNLNSGSRVRFPARTTRLKLTMLFSFSLTAYRASLQEHRRFSSTSISHTVRALCPRALRSVASEERRGCSRTDPGGFSSGIGSLRWCSSLPCVYNGLLDHKELETASL